MGIEGGANNSEVQNQEINQVNNERIEQNNADHQRSASELEANATIDNYGEQKQIEVKDDSATNDFSEDDGNGLDDDSSIEPDNQNFDNTQEVENSQNEAEAPDNQNTIENSKIDSTGIDDIDSIDSLDVAADKVEEDEGDYEEESASKLDLNSDINTENYVDDSVEEDNEQTDNLDNDSCIESNSDDETGEDKPETTEENAKDKEGLDNKPEDILAESEGIETNEEKSELETTSDASNENVDNSNADAEGSKPSDFEAKDINNKEDIGESSNSNFVVGDELKDSLKSFEQKNWDSMDINEQKEAINDLRDKVADDLELQNKPEVKYYNNNDNTDFGGYSPSENAIYINEHNMGDAAETADTIAHEARHCWQRERAENPQNEQDREFKENFDDYIRPEDDYRGYKNQPVEIDARDYASCVSESIDSPSETQEAVFNDGNSKKETSYSDMNEMKGAVFDQESLPEDFKSKTYDFESKLKKTEEYGSDLECSIQQKLENYYKENYGQLADEQKQNMVDDLKKSYDSAPTEDRHDILVPEKADSVDDTGIYYNDKKDKYDIAYDWKPVDTLPESRKMEVMKEGQQFDRVGPPSGRCVGAIDENGNCATIEQRSIPYHFTETDITKESSYHRYVAEQDFTKDNLNKAIENSLYSDEKMAEMKANVDKYYERSITKGYGYGDGLATGKIAPMFEGTGGGKQYDMPLSIEELENIGMISEIPKEQYRGDL